MSKNKTVLCTTFQEHTFFSQLKILQKVKPTIDGSWNIDFDSGNVILHKTQNVQSWSVNEVIYVENNSNIFYSVLGKFFLIHL